MKALCFTVFILSGWLVAGATCANDYFGGVDSAAYEQWYNAASARYTHAKYLPSLTSPNNGAAIHWKIEKGKIYLAVAARATGWVGFGLAEAGAMKGADMVLYEAATNELTDAYVLDELLPIQDDCQNWVLQDSQTDGGFLIFEAMRELNTGDLQDRPIVNDAAVEVAPHRIIAAWGDTATVMYHGQDKRARSAVRFYGEQDADPEESFRKAMNAEAEGSVVLTAVNHQVKPVDTEYVYFCFSLNDLLAQGMPADTPLHAIGFEPIVDAVSHVHHYILMASASPNKDMSTETCDDFDFMEMAYVWAPGEGSFVLPSNAGGPLGLGGYNSFQLEIHYDNPTLIEPTLIEGAVDSSGVKIYYTSQRREHDIGVLQLGDPFVGLGGKPVGSQTDDGLYSHNFDCAAGCSTGSIQEPITVIREYLHMHRTGKRIYNQQLRNGEVHRTGSIEYWDFDARGNQAVQQEPFQILPGDSFQTRCYYDVPAGSQFGLSSQDEMCIAFLFYYPRQLVFGQYPYLCVYNYFGACDASYEKQALTDRATLDRSFGSTNGVCRPLLADTTTLEPSPLATSATPTPVPTTMPPTPVSSTLEPTPTLSPTRQALASLDAPTSSARADGTWRLGSGCVMAIMLASWAL